jgi:hypothetical protein
MRDGCLDEGKDARHRPLRTAAETERLEKLREGALVFRTSLNHDDVGLGVAESAS